MDRQLGSLITKRSIRESQWIAKDSLLSTFYWGYPCFSVDVYTLQSYLRL